MSDMTQAELELRRALTAMTARATQAEAKWHRAATHDSSIDEAEVIHELRQEVARLRKALAGTVLYIDDCERVYKDAHGQDYVEHHSLAHARQTMLGTKEGG